MNGDGTAITAAFCLVILQIYAFHAVKCDVILKSMETVDGKLAQEILVGFIPHLEGRDCKR